MDNIEKIFVRLQKFISSHYVLTVHDDLALYLTQQKIEPFYQVLNRYLAYQQMTKRSLSAKLQDRRSIYRIYHEKKRVPTKRLVICIAFCLGLTQADFLSFLHAAGYHLSCHILSDVVVMFCLTEGIYEAVYIDLCMEKVGEKPLFYCYSR